MLLSVMIAGGSFVKNKTEYSILKQFRHNSLLSSVGNSIYWQMKDFFSTTTKKYSNILWCNVDGPVFYLFFKEKKQQKQYSTP